MRQARWVRASISLLAVWTLLSASVAQAYPEKPVSLIVPFGAGGLPDQVARNLAEAAKPHFPKAILVVNRPGGAGTVGGAEVVQAKPDGYTIGITTKGPMLVQPQISNLPYKGPADFLPVIKLVNPPLVWAVRAEAPWSTMKEVLEYAKTNPGKIRVAHPGAGSLQHLTLETLKEKAGVDMTPVPFGGGGGEMTAAVLGGHVEATVIPPVVILGLVQAGKMRVLATFEEKRNPLFPDVPTVRELGYDVTGGNPLFVFAPNGTPDHVVQAIHDAFKKAIESESFTKFAQSKSLVIDYKGPTELKQELEGDHALFGALVKKLNLKK